MCHPGVFLVSREDLVGQQRWMVQQAGGVDGRRSQAAGEGGGFSGSIKQCLCSPTTHPGSFKCRKHHADYVWGGRLANK
ncbi:hypothetical protein HS088_TW04G00558 [Tripterygium wilfordii]|uniref:Uncharacterized protein n=1 Tax=Tripterygium wilfordii TaxID=458696 RepID=A0A7J7DQF6_TRIWF|nr:hypothetical protein HS088_TW04G00558 [Tripterygium wilfordii]